MSCCQSSYGGIGGGGGGGTDNHAALNNLNWTVSGHTGTVGSIALFDGTGAASLLSGVAQGDLAFFDGTDWVRLVPGTAGHVLQTQGAGADPIWAAAPGGTSDHALLTNLAWSSSGHTGVIGALAGFAGDGTATTYSRTMGGDLTGTYPNPSVANNAITNAKLADVATATIKGRVTAGAGDPEDLSSAQATTLINVFSDTLKGVAPASGGGTTNFLRADGAWADPSGSGITPAQHKALRDLIHFIDNGPADGFASGAVRELSYTGSLVTQVIWWTDAGKTQKIVQTDVTYTGALSTSEVWQMFDTDGVTVLVTLTDAISYSGALETERTRTWVV